MSAWTDPPARPAQKPWLPPKAPARTESAPCSWCLGAGKYLERLDVEEIHVHLPVVCQGCMGSGTQSV